MGNLNKYRNKQGQIWLNVASSVYVIEDFVNLDNHVFLHFKGLLPTIKKIIPKKYDKLADSYIQASNKALLIKHDCKKALFFPDNSVDHILCSHFLEHIYPADATFVMNDFKRVLKPGGTLHVIVPDLNKNIKDYIKAKEAGKPEAADEFIVHTLLSKRDKGSFKYRVMEFHGGFGLQHRWMYDHESMSKKVKETGFAIVEGNNTPSRHFRENDDSVHIVAVKQ